MAREAVTIEPEEIFPDAQHQEAGLPLAGLGFLERAISRRALWVSAGTAFAFLAFLLAVAVRTVAGCGSGARDAAAENRVRTFFYGAARGVIADRFGKVLAANTPRFSLVVFPDQLPKNPEADERLWHDLEHLLGGPMDLFEHFSRVAKEEKEPFRLPLKLTVAEAAALSEREKDLPGVVLIEERERAYPWDESLSHVLGYVSGEQPGGVGKVGVESLYNSELEGQDGARTWVQDARGGTRRVLELKKPKEGATVTLTLDGEFARASFDIITAALKRLGLKRAAFVAIDPRNGEVLALTSVPTFSSEAFAAGLSGAEFAKIRDDPAQPFFNRAIAGLYAPGSSIKPFLAAAALAEGIIDPKKTIFVTGAIDVKSPYDPSVVYTFRDWRAHGAVDMTRALAVSSNVYFYTVGGGYGEQKGLGIEKMDQYLRRFGFGAVSGIDLPGEAAGWVPSPQWKARVKGEAWYIGDTYHTAIGQGDLVVTPLQLAVATAAVANGGTLWRPRLMSAVEGERLSVSVAKNASVLPAWALDVPRRGMREAATDGSARFLADLPLPVAGKTGTAQTGRGTAHAWFTGFAPFENPEIVLTLIVEDGGEGSAVAVPIAKEIFKWWIEHRTK